MREDYAAIGAAIERAAKELPDGAEIRIVIERGAGTVYWSSSSLDDEQFIDSGELFSTQINAAIDAAREKRNQS